MAISESSDNRHTALVLAVVCGLGVAHHRWIEAPWRVLREDLEAQVAVLEERDRVTLAQTHADPGALEAHVLRLEREVRRLEARLPATNDLPRIHQVLQQEAHANALALLAFQPGEVIEEEVGSPYVPEAYRLDVEGTYHDVGRFLGAVASLPEILRPGVLSMERTARAQVRASLTIDTLRRPEAMGGERWSVADALAPATDVDRRESAYHPRTTHRDPVAPFSEEAEGFAVDGWALRALMISAEPERSLAVFEWINEEPYAPPQPVKRPRTVRLRAGDLLGSAQVQRILADGVEMRLPSMRAGHERRGEEPIVWIPFMRRTASDELRSVVRPSLEMEP
jgi:Tfp pilus assembly protein PilO